MRSLLNSEPLVLAGVLAAGIVLVAGHFGVILDKPTITSVLTPIVVAVLARFKVTPVNNSAPKSP